ncbi:MAG: dihydroorotase, partial [Bacteroidales bacterium]|nr:dihydroorotase [Bacteroidales bacterium]
IFSESRAATAGGVTSFMDMPNTVPQAVSLKILEEKFLIASEKSLVNYSFYLGATNTNIDEMLSADPEKICGIKLFLGASTGNMLVNDNNSIRKLLSSTPMLVACHCEDEGIINSNREIFTKKYGENIPPECHPFIRSRDACFKSTEAMVNMAGHYNTRLHLLHISTADEIRLLSNNIPAGQKRITSEACVHHLWFDDSFYRKLGNRIKWNPAIKTAFDRRALIDGLNAGFIDVVATDHAPHTLAEKSVPYMKAPSGGPMIQHSLPLMMELYHSGLISPETIVEKMCHNPARIFRIKNRGFIREGYKADICIVNPADKWTVSAENIFYKCGWSPLEGTTLRSSVEYTIVNGNIVYDRGYFNEQVRGERLLFNQT